ncbi:MAG TPA: DUF5916 domain-containing protein [Polyangiales bacterium]|jgi:hypothetical protein|nr:DUF5916 domain-containing protein [Polyangiales bacterium]
MPSSSSRALDALASFAVFTSFLAAGTALADTKKLVAAPRGHAPIVIDGVLDEAAWSTAPVGDAFTERLPVPGAKPPVQTTVRVLYDEEALYIGIRCELLPGEHVKADNLARDVTRIWRDDALTIKLDVRNDKRSVVGFAVNPENAQLDFLSLDNGDVFRVEYDAVWESQTHVTDTYWSAELRLPAAALGLPRVNGERVIGFDIARDHNARLATDDWQLIPPEFGPYSAQHYGELTGVRGIASGRPLMLQPYLALQYPREPDDVLPLRTKAGGDARLRLANDTWGELSLLTDFAQADVDDQVVNLNRFPIFYPERRQFFLTGLDVFEFGRPGTAQLLFTRRIGLDAQRHEVPMLAGAKVYGTSGPFDFGALDVLTDDTLTVQKDPKLPPLGQSAANWAVGRGRVNFAHPGHVGFLVATRDNLDLPLEREARPVSTDPSVAVGLDGLVQGFDKRLVVSSFGAYTHNELAATTTQGGIADLRLQWLGETLQPDVSLMRVSNDFDPLVGFIERKGVLQTDALVPWITRTSALGLDNFTLWNEVQFVHDENAHSLLGRTLGESFTTTWRSGYQLDIGVTHLLDVVQSSFNLFPDLEIEPGRYDGWKVRAQLVFPTARNPSFDVQYTANDAFFTGYSHAVSSHTSIAATKHVRVTAGAVFTVLTLRRCLRVSDAATSTSHLACGEPFAWNDTGPDVRRSTLSWNSTLSVTPSTVVQTDLVFQLNTQTDQALGMLRLRYRYAPGSDLFLVYQEQVDYAGSKVESDRRIIFKAAYRYDAML